MNTYRNFLFADEWFFWNQLRTSNLFCDDLQWLDCPSCIAEPDEFFPAMDPIEE